MLKWTKASFIRNRQNLIEEVIYAKIIDNPISRTTLLSPLQLTCTIHKLTHNNDICKFMCGISLVNYYDYIATFDFILPGNKKNYPKTYKEYKQFETMLGI